MTEGPKLAVFDIDGTIANHGVIASGITDGMRHIQSLGFSTTVSSGRGFLRARDALGAAFDTIVSPDALMIVEHGAKIVDRSGTVVKGDYFEPSELDHVIDFVRANAAMVQVLWTLPIDPRERIQVWCKDAAGIPAETEKRRTYADVFTCSYEELRGRMTAYPISSVTTKLEPYISVENLKLHFTRSEIDVVFQDSMMEFVRNISDKAKALAYLEAHHGISRENMLVAGNAINDVDMLNIDASMRILVGNEPKTATVLGHLVRPENVIRVDTPEDLALYLQKLEA